MVWYPWQVPQFTRFPFLPPGAPASSVEALIDACVAMPAEGQPLKEFRNRLKQSKLWSREDAGDTLRFLRLAKSKTVRPSELISELQAAADVDARKTLLAERLWHANPILFKSVFDLLAERPFTRDEISTYLQSTAYRGQAPSNSQVRLWLQLATGLGLLKVVGIAIKIDSAGEEFGERVKDFDLEEFLEEDVPEPELAAGDETEGVSAPVDEQSEAAPTAAAQTVAAAPPTVPYSSPLGRARPVPVARFADGIGGFGDELLGETRERIAEWWAEQTPVARFASAADFGIGSESWMEGADEALYRLAVAAALAFRLGRSTEAVVAAFTGLDKAGVLADLYFGTAPDSLPEAVDSQSLMLASLVARRCAEAPELAVTLEKQKDAAGAFSELEGALGRGLFSLELFWMMRALGEIGALRLDDIETYSALPTRLVRDTLFRLGFIESPYASGSSQLALAAVAASKAAPSPAPDSVLEGFALAARCQYDCPHRRGCEYACRERSDS